MTRSCETRVDNLNMSKLHMLREEQINNRKTKDPEPIPVGPARTPVTDVQLQQCAETPGSLSFHPKQNPSKSGESVSGSRGSMKQE